MLQLAPNPKRPPQKFLLQRDQPPCSPRPHFGTLRRVDPFISVASFACFHVLLALFHHWCILLLHLN
ncbi:hypothetical protein BDN71DRAFT_602812 [Pleurotus eryngii]|uniref:Transmembrane protein n=1 Tax=Pleurotus eryngii TaxID=5323 RepID=A0A9P5ZHP2_PLEER|nr:hypothetical protein BDN71DRAFT_602812 [Pleurotus eryngii]